MDRGPPADDARACTVFRALWGPRAELRRFKDGSIVEAVRTTEAGYPGRAVLHRRSGALPQYGENKCVASEFAHGVS